MGHKDKPSTPQNWPASLHYLTAPSYSPALTKAQLTAIRTQPPDDEDVYFSAGFKTGKNVRITPITDQRHPAYGQSGLFAARDLKPGELIVVYLGETHPGSYNDGGSGGGAQPRSNNPHADSDYDLWLDRAADVAVDAARAGNEARFINDYRGVPGLAQRRPNAEFRVVWDSQRGEKVMAVFVLPAGKKAVGKALTVGVSKGQEILVSYGKGFWQERSEGLESERAARSEP